MDQCYDRSYIFKKLTLWAVCDTWDAESEHTLDTFILASKKFHTLWFTRLISYFNVNYLGFFLHYNIYENSVKLAAFKISYLK